MDLGTVLQQLGVVAVFVQRVVAFVKNVTGYTTRVGEKYQGYVDLALSVVVSALVCVGWQIDLLSAVHLYFPYATLGVWSVYLAEALTGVVAALGSNVLNDLLALYQAYKDKQVPA